MKAKITDEDREYIRKYIAKFYLSGNFSIKIHFFHTHLVFFNGAFPKGIWYACLTVFSEIEIYFFILVGRM